MPQPSTLILMIDLFYTGVNTGYGGSADVRTKDTLILQDAMIRELNFGILPPGARDPRDEPLQKSLNQHRYEMSLDHGSETTYLPCSWARVSILIRINSLIKGASGVRPVIANRM